MTEIVPDLFLVIYLIVAGGVVYLGYLAIRALRKYLRS